MRLPPQVANYAHKAVGPPPGYYNPRNEYGYYAPSEAMMRVTSTHLRHPGPFVTSHNWLVTQKSQTRGGTGITQSAPPRLDAKEQEDMGEAPAEEAKAEEAMAEADHSTLIHSLSTKVTAAAVDPTRIR